MRRTRTGRAGGSKVRALAASLAIAALAAACSPAAVAGPSAEERDAPVSMTDDPVIDTVDAELTEEAPSPEPPPVEAPFALSEAEVYPNAKRLAADVAQALTTYDPDQSVEEVVAGLDAVVDPDRLAEQARDLHEPGA